MEGARWKADLWPLPGYAVTAPSQAATPILEWWRKWRKSQAVIGRLPAAFLTEGDDVTGRLDGAIRAAVNEKLEEAAQRMGPCRADDPPEARLIYRSAAMNICRSLKLPTPEKPENGTP